MKYWQSLAFACLYLMIGTVAHAQEPKQKSPQLQFLDDVTIPQKVINKIKITELSDLAWDQDEQVLYAVSDRGNLFHFKITIKDNRIKAVKPTYAAVLRDRKGRPLDWRDAEGIDLRFAKNKKKGDTQLLIALEGVPRVAAFNTKGKLLRFYKLPKALKSRHKFRHTNTALESVTWHPIFGYLTAPEQSVKGQPENLHSIYSRYKRWSFMAYPAKKSAITALQVLPNGNLLILERAWSGMMNPLTVSLRYLDFRRCSRDGACELQDLKVLKNRLLVDNFEGLTHIGNNQYLMVSDDGNSQWLRTSLTLFKLDL